MSDAPETVSSKIDQVTVFRFGAEVRRVAELPLPDAYPAELRLHGLPLQLRDDTLQLAVEPLDGGAPLACPQAVDVRVALEPPPPDPALPPATDQELRDAEHALRQQRRRVERIDGQLEALGELSSPPRPEPAEGEPPLPSPTQARLALLAFQQAELERLHDERAAAREQLRLASEALALLKTRRHAHRKQRQLDPHELRKEARITLRAPAADGEPVPRCRVVLSYLVPAARWAPAYSLHLDAAGGPARITMRAQICQLSDEDWSGVRLVLSTADALRWTELPELNALRVGRAQAPAPSAGWRPPPQGAEALLEDWARAQALIPPGGSSTPPPAPAPPVPLSHAEPAPEPEPECEDEEVLMEMAFAATEQPMRRSRRKAKRSARPAAPQAKSTMRFGAGGMAPPPAQAASAPMAANAISDAPVSGGYDGGHLPPPALEAGRDLLDYDSLRMAGPGQARPGRLAATDSFARYRELLPATQQATLPQGGALKAHIRGAAARVRSAALSGGLQPPASVDAYDHAWRAERPVDVPADGHFHTVPVLGCDAVATIGYVVVPRETQEVFRTVTITNPLGAPLLSGPVDVYLGGDYLLAASVNTVPAGGELQLGLGVEQGIRVSRNTRYAESQRGMMSRHQDLEHKLELELRNLLAQPIRIEVRERIPVHREDDDDVEIDLREVQPPWEPWEQPDAQLRGAYRWRLELQPGQVRQLRATYVITISPKHELSGGNRREG